MGKECIHFLGHSVYIYIYMCVCVCVCVCARARAWPLSLLSNNTCCVAFDRGECQDILYYIHGFFRVPLNTYFSVVKNLIPELNMTIVELHFSRLIGAARHPEMQKIWIIGCFFENRLLWQFEFRLLLFTVCTCV